jgi:hypothetical protein
MSSNHPQPPISDSSTQSLSIRKKATDSQSLSLARVPQDVMLNLVFDIMDLDTVDLLQKGMPYIPVADPLHEYLPSVDVFKAEEYWYFLRISRGTHVPDWNGMVPLKAVCESGNVLGKGVVVEEDSGTDNAPQRQNGGELQECNETILPCYVGGGLDKMFDPGQALQLRFDIQSLPWSKDVLEGMNSRDVPFVGIVGIHKITGACHVLVADKALVKWDQRCHVSGSVLSYLERYIYMEMSFSTNADGHVETAELTVLATLEEVENYL